jgi:hypothetical protein
LDYGGYRTDDRGDTLFLRRTIERFCRMPTDRLNVRRVVLVAKSRFGRGEASLGMGRYESRYERIRGVPEDFYSSYGYDRVFFPVYSRDNFGPLYIKLRGHIKVARVVLVLDGDDDGRDHDDDGRGDGRRG